MSFIVKVSDTPPLPEDSEAMFSIENVKVDGMGGARVKK
jgi:hypothetical protein